MSNNNEVEKAHLSAQQVNKVGSTKSASLFTRIIRREIPSEILYEDNDCIAIKDISPQAPVHFLVIPKLEITGISNLLPEQSSLLMAAKKVAEEQGISQNGYRLVINDGAHGCQSVYHLHIHVLGGRQLNWPPG